jgi:hypothetical protein
LCENAPSPENEERKRPVRFLRTVITNRLHDLDQIEHSEMENDEDQHRDEHEGVFAFLKDFLEH